MKAFQLKIVIKNSKPPIWRRLIVPAGITFSQLSMILNKVMGWHGNHLFEFEFYHLELKIIEDVDEFTDYNYGPFDYLESTNTYIREYLEQNDWFTYTYDLGDDWQHRVTVEKIIYDYEFNYPVVLKYKGDSPVEDSGGIYGYYDCLDIISNKNDPEYEDCLEWMESKGYPYAYDMEAVNHELKEGFFYKWGKGENRRQSDIYNDFFSEKYGLCATKRDKNKNLAIVKSTKHKIEDSLQQMADMFNQYDRWQQDVGKMSLKDILSDYVKEDLVEIARDKGVKGISGCNKDKLIDKVISFMLKTEVIEAYFLCQTDCEIEPFEKAISLNNIYDDVVMGITEKLYQTSYIALMADGRFIIPTDVAEKYRSIVNEEFRKKRQNISFVLCCLKASGIIYGIVPVDVFMEMLKTNKDVSLSEDEVKEVINNMPPEYAEYIVKGNKIYHKALYPNDRGLLKVQGDKKYYIPNKEEIIHLGIKGYLPDNKELEKLTRFFVQKIGISLEQAEYVGMCIQHNICGDCSMQEVIDILNEEGIVADNDKQLNEMIELIQDMWNNTRMLLNRGFTPYEVSKQERIRLLPSVTQKKTSNIISFEKAKKSKIYPNDMCPCGSGKKHKFCCMNQDKN